jgi:prepilin-type N-terminal cleavage/methylation domain-containing protein
MLHSPRSTAGFTLVEIMIVVLLMSILAMAVIPSAAPSVHDELTSVAQILAADLAYGRSLAVLNNDHYQFQFDLTNNQYTLSYSGSNSALSTLPPSPFQSSQDPAGQYVVRLANLPRLGIPVTLYDVQSLTPQPVEAASVEFGPLGATTQTQPTVIWLSAGAGAAARYISVSLNPATGLATVGGFQATVPTQGSAAPPSASGTSTSGSAGGTSKSSGSSQNTGSTGSSGVNNLIQTILGS